MSSFDVRAATWDDNPKRVERANLTGDAIAERIPLARSWSVVDIGSGTGLLSRSLSDRVGSIVLIDTSQGMTDVAAQRIAADGMDTLKAVCLDIADATPPGAPYDMAMSLLVLHHVRDIGSFLETVRRHLKPGGYIAFADVAAEDGTFHDDPNEEVFHHGFEPDELSSLAVSVGFTDVAVDEIHRMVKPRDGHQKSYGLVLLTGRVPASVSAK